MLDDGPTWPDALYQRLRELGITVFCYVPDGGHKRLIERALADEGAHAIALTTEEEGVALLAGCHLGDACGVLLMQSSGVGNCVNLFSLLTTARIPFLTLVSMRGEYGEQNPWQVPMGRATRPVMEAMGLVCLSVERPDDVEAAATAAFNMAFRSTQAVAMLLSQRLIGAKAF
jgi:sulfopyruvate decarboxylase alpha subunit